MHAKHCFIVYLYTDEASSRWYPQLLSNSSDLNDSNAAVNLMTSFTDTTP